METKRIILLVPPLHVKRVKSSLEENSLLDKTRKIVPEEHDHDGPLARPRMRIPTRILTTLDRHDDSESVQNENERILQQLGLGDLEKDIEILLSTTTGVSADREQKPLIKALAKGLEELPETLLASLDITPASLINTFPTTYSIYKPMLLLPSGTFTSHPWTTLLSFHPLSSPTLTPIWQSIASAVGTTHIVVNAGIPPSTSPRSSLQAQENILRSPVNLTPIYGDFGPPPTPERQQHPTQSDFSEAFWVSTTQNGIHQVWAPLYTMFSRGNIREKTRLLTLPSVQRAVAEGKNVEESRSGATALDFYAGIGYFSFSYRRAGVKLVLCWELNPWSIEGLRRGAHLNTWTTKIYSNLDNPQKYSQMMSELKDSTPSVDFIIFQQSNEHALGPTSVLSRKRDDGGGRVIPPIRHINLGLLPSSQLSWRDAVRAIDEDLGGWIHAHENVGVGDFGKRAEEVVEIMQGYVDECETERNVCGKYRRKVRCEHVERVKTYAPGVVHAVFDVWIGGLRDGGESVYD